MAMRTRTVTRTNRGRMPKLVVYRGIQYQEQMLPDDVDRSEVQTLEEWRQSARSGSPLRGSRRSAPTATAQDAPDSREVKEEATEGSGEPGTGAPEPPVVNPAKDISELSYEDLKALATERGVEFKTNIKKVDLIELLSA